MAAFIGWVDANVGATPQKRGSPALVAGGTVREVAQAWTKATTDGNGTLYFLFEIPSDAILTSLLLYNDAISGLSSASVGLFLPDLSLGNLGGPNQTVANYYAGCSTTGLPHSTPVDASAILMALTDISAGNVAGTPLSCLSAVSVQTITTLGATTNGFLNYEKKVWELLGYTDPKWKEDSYAVGMYVATAGSAAGNLAIRGRYIQA